MARSIAAPERAAAALVAVALGSWSCAAPESAVSKAGVVRASSGCRAPAPAASGTVRLEAGGLERSYLLRLPPDYDPALPVALVLHFHGYTGTSESTEAYTGLSRHAAENGYAVVYPQGTGFVTDEGETITSWNDLAGSRSAGPTGPICSDRARGYPFPPECGEPAPCIWASCHDDLAFVVAMLERLGATVCLDLDRVYATGMSNGAMFVHRLGCAMPERFAAIAPVAGTLARGFACAPSAPLAMMNVYGRDDTYVSQNGVESSDGYFYTSAADVMRAWASPEAQDCEPEATPYPTSLDGELGLECVQHAHCATGAEVVHCTWNGGHDWPADERRSVGNDLVWEFFSAHVRGSR